MDLPLREDYPYFWASAIKSKLLVMKPPGMTRRVFLESFQFAYENYFQLEVGLYEFYFMGCLSNLLVPKKFHHWFFFKLVVLATALYSRWFNLGVVLGSCFLPVFFYYFFVLVDYYEVIEELLAIIKNSS